MLAINMALLYSWTVCILSFRQSSRRKIQSDSYSTFISHGSEEILAIFFWIKSKSSIQKGIEDIFKYLPFRIDDLQLLHYLQRNFLNNQSFFSRF